MNVCRVGGCVHACMCVLIPVWFIKSDCKFLLKVRIAEAVAFSASKCIAQQGILCVKTKQWDLFAVFVFLRSTFHGVYVLCIYLHAKWEWRLLRINYNCLSLCVIFFFSLFSNKTFFTLFENFSHILICTVNFVNGTTKCTAFAKTGWKISCCCSHGFCFGNVPLICLKFCIEGVCPQSSGKQWWCKPAADDVSRSEILQRKLSTLVGAPGTVSAD